MTDDRWMTDEMRSPPEHEGLVTGVISRLDAAVDGSDVDTVVRQVKAVLERLVAEDAVRLPPRFGQPGTDRYARRLLHRDPAGAYSAVVMTWGPGQGTPIHDHAGIWCVECVLQGAMEVEQYHLVSEEAGSCRFASQRRIEARVGEAGYLIPPFDHHTLANHLSDRPSVTLHIYGGEMSSCDVFEPEPGGTFRRHTRPLSYDE